MYPFGAVSKQAIKQASKQERESLREQTRPQRKEGRERVRPAPYAWEKKGSPVLSRFHHSDATPLRASAGPSGPDLS